MQQRNDKIMHRHCANKRISQRHVVMAEKRFYSQNVVRMRADLGRAFAVNINYESICNISPEQSSIPATSALTFVFLLTRVVCVAFLCIQLFGSLALYVAVVVLLARAGKALNHAKHG